MNVRRAMNNGRGVISDGAISPGRLISMWSTQGVKKRRQALTAEHTARFQFDAPASHAAWMG